MTEQEYTPCAWCEAPAMGFASPDPGRVAESESCGADGHGLSFRPDAAMLEAWLAEHDRQVQAEALEQAEKMADRIVEDAEERRRTVRADGEYWQGFSHGASKVSWSIHKRAQAIREARND